MSSDITQINPKIPQEQALKFLNDNDKKLEGKGHKALFVQNELDQLFSDLGVPKQWVRNLSLGNDVSSVSNWTHIKAESGYSIWKFPVVDFKDNPENSLYFDDKRLTYQGVALAELGTAFDSVLVFDGVSYTDQTSEAGSEFGTPFSLLQTSDGVFYIGHNQPFSGFDIELETLGLGLSLTIEYSKGSGVWGTVSELEDNTGNLTRSGKIKFALPGDFATNAVNGTTKYWVRINSSVTPVIPPKAYFIQPLSSVVNLLSLSSFQILNEAWVWCFFNGYVYVTLKNAGIPQGEGTTFITSGSSSTTKANFFVYEHEIQISHERDSFSPAGFTTSQDYRSFVQGAAGLLLTVNGGRILKGSTFYNHTQTLLTLPTNSHSYIFINSSGALSFNTTGFTDSCFPISEVVTGLTITSVTDRRSFLNLKLDPFVVGQIGTPTQPITNLYATTISATSITATTLTGTLATAAQPNVTSLGTLFSLTVSGPTTISQLRSSVNPTFNYLDWSAGDFVLYTKNAGATATERFRITSNVATSIVSFLNANVGIGTASPTAPLHVIGAGLFTSSLSADSLAINRGSDAAVFVTCTGSSDFSRISLNNSGGVANSFQAILSGSGRSGNRLGVNLAGLSLLQTSGSSDNGLMVDVSTAKSIYFATNGNLRAIIDSSGNIGIGTITPASKLTVAGDIRIEGFTHWGIEASESPALQIIDRTNNIRRGIFTTSGNVFLGGTMANVGGTNAVLSIVSGKVGIGTIIPSEALDVSGSIAIKSESALVFNPSGSSTKWGVVSCNSGGSINYNGIFIASNTKKDGTQGDTTLSSWAIDIGGLDSFTYGPDQFGIFRKGGGATTFNALFKILANGNVGIGIASPGTKFDVVTATGNKVQFGNLPVGTSGEYVLTLGFASNIPFLQSQQISQGWIALALQPSGGNVGIGTSTPAYTLDVSRDLGIGDVVTCRLSNIHTSGGTVLKIDRQNPARATSLILADTWHVGVLRFAGSPTYRFGISTVADMNITAPEFCISNGKIGISTANPTDLFTIYKPGFTSTLGPSMTLLWDTGYGDSFSRIQFGDGTYVTGYLKAGRQGSGGSFFDFQTSAYNAAPSSRLYISDAGSIGIGTTNPGAPLHVVQASSGYPIARFTHNGPSEYSLIQIQNSDSTASNVVIGTGGTSATNGAFANKAVFGTTMAAPISLITNDTERFSITSSGNVGAGISSPSYRFHIADLTQDNTPYKVLQAITASNSTESNLGTFGYDITKPSFGLAFRRLWVGSTYTDVSGIYGFGSGNWRGGMVFLTKNNTDNSGVPDTLAMTLAANGNIGIGVASPNAKLDISGLTFVRTPSMADNTKAFSVTRIDGSTQQFSIVTHYTSTWATELSATNSNLMLSSFLGGGSGGNLLFHTGTATAAEKMRLDVNGNLGIGTTTPYNKLTVNGDIYAVSTAYNSGGFLLGAAVGSYDWRIANAGSALIFGSVQSGVTTERMRIDTSGNVIANDGNFKTHRGGFYISNGDTVIWGTAQYMSALVVISNNYDVNNAVRNGVYLIQMDSEGDAITTVTTISSYNGMTATFSYSGGNITVSGMPAGNLRCMVWRMG